MTRLLPRYLRRFLRYLKWLCRKNSYPSIYFYTFHKCASSLFSGYVLRNFDGLRFVNYAGQIYNGKKVDKIRFEERGYVYGPIRISTDRLSPVYARLVKPASDIRFVRDKTAIFLLRDPRDILVSAYYSFGGSHGLSQVDQIKSAQNRQKEEIRSMGIDAYAINASHEILENFETLFRLCEACEKSVVLRYEDMIDNWERFAADLTRYADLKPAILQQIYARSRPRDREDKASHRRSGKTGGFRNKLSSKTIGSLNVTFGAVLERFGYDP